MELNERNIIIDDSLNRIAEAGMESYITHAFCSAGECEVWYGGSRWVYLCRIIQFVPVSIHSKLRNTETYV